MKTKSRLFAICILTILANFLIQATAVIFAQTSKSTASYPAHLPYRFSNIVWWDDDELRVLLKKRIPGLGDEVATTRAAEGRIRDTLTELLKEKGIVAEVQSEEPGPSAFAPVKPIFLGPHPPEAPHPAITFSLLTPKVLIGKIIFQDVPQEAEQAMEREVKSNEGRPYNAIYNTFQQKRLVEVIGRQGYLEAQVTLKSQPPRKDGNEYRVDVVLAVAAGSKYHIASITADGGPLLAGKDLSRFVVARQGDVAGGSPFGDLGPQIRALYEHQGYADVDIEGEPVLDRERAVAAYHLTVDPGPLYHLRSLKLEKLTPDQEAKVRELFGLKVGDVFDNNAINQLYHKMSSEPSLQGLGFGFSPKRDQALGAVDLTLDFYKEGGEATVTIK